MKFKNNDIFGDLTFLDILEEASIPFVYVNGELTFLHNATEVLARELWSRLTGCYNIGQYD